MRISNAKVFVDGRFLPGGIAFSERIEAIGKADEIGSLAPGKAADFVLLDSDLRVRSVYIDGSPVAPVC